MTPGLKRRQGGSSHLYIASPSDARLKRRQGGSSHLLALNCVVAWVGGLKKTSQKCVTQKGRSISIASSEKDRSCQALNGEYKVSKILVLIRSSNFITGNENCTCFSCSKAPCHLSSWKCLPHTQVWIITACFSVIYQVKLVSHEKSSGSAHNSNYLSAFFLQQPS